MRKIISTIAALASLTALTSIAYAEVPAQVHFEVGAAVPLGKPLSDTFSPGPALEIKPLWSVHPNWSIGPMVSGMYLPRTFNVGKQDATLWQIGPAARVQWNRFQDDWRLPKFSPWVDLSVTFAANGNDSMGPAVNVGAGIEAPLDNHKIFWLGPLVKYTHMFVQGNDLNLLQVGFSFSFDVPVRVPVETVRVPVVHVKHDVKVVVKEIPVVKEVVPLSFSEKVYFAVNSSTLHWESKDKLDAVVQKLNSDKKVKIQVQGNSSSDGALDFNLKLSQKRMQVVLDYLVKHGVDPTRLVANNAGVSHPVASNKTKEGRERNRRVEFTVTFTSVK